MTFGQYLVVGLESAFFVFGLIAFFSTKNTQELAGTAVLMALTALIYGFFSTITGVI